MPPVPLNAVVAQVTQRVSDRSEKRRADYLAQLRSVRRQGPDRQHMSCANLAHAAAALPTAEKWVIREQRAPAVGIVSAYNDMLSAHQPYEHFPALIKAAAKEAGSVAMFAGGVPAMCDGVTQGQPGMELSLFSRDVIAMSTAIALSHQTFDAALYLGVCDKIVPGLLIGALQFGHLPGVFVPAGPMASGLPNSEKAKIRQAFARGDVGREALLEAEMAAYHGVGTCTFYGTANSNQLLMEVMGLHLPGSAFVPPQGPLRAALVKHATKHVLDLAQAQMTGEVGQGIGEIVDARSVVNAMVALLATGGSTNHTIHLVAMARAAGIIINWDDFDELSGVTPLLARVYPNGSADVNQFHAAGGVGFLIRELLSVGLLHADARTILGEGLQPYCQEPFLDAAEQLHWRDAPTASLDENILRPAARPFSVDGGLRTLRGNLGRSVIKVSAVAPEHRVVIAPVEVFSDQDDVLAAFKAGLLNKDCVVVVRFQGPMANGMPELHKLTPALAVLQEKGYRVALVTDGRMSGASGKVPAAIHLTPEAAAGGALALMHTGDLVRLDAENGELTVQVPPSEWSQRVAAERPVGAETLGRALFAGRRSRCTSAEEGATDL